MRECEERVQGSVRVVLTLFKLGKNVLRMESRLRSRGGAPLCGMSVSVLGCAQIGSCILLSKNIDFGQLLSLELSVLLINLHVADWVWSHIFALLLCRQPRLPGASVLPFLS